MNAALMWKEYRQLRGVWIVVTLLAVLVLEGLLATVGSTTSWLDHINTSRTVLISIVVSSIVAHGVVVGAMLIARDKEDGTEAFLESLTCRRSGVWWNKLTTGVVLVILQGLAMVALLVGHGASTFEESALLPLLGVAMLAWGMLGGVLCRHVLSATLLASLLMAGSWLLALPLSISPQFFVITEGVFSLGALVAAQAFYCQPDQRRLPEAARHATLRFLAWSLAIGMGLLAGIVFLIVAYRLSYAFHLGAFLLLAFELYVFVSILLMLRSRIAGWLLILLAAGLSALFSVTAFPLLFGSIARIPELFLVMELIACSGAALLSRMPPNKNLDAPKWRRAWPAFVGSWKSTFWLVSRQGKWVFLGAALIALVSGATARLAPLFFWPIGSMLVGILCGLGVFCPDQKEGRVFWASQRLPAGRIWFTKIVTWGALLAVALMLSGMADTWWSLRENTVDFRLFGWLDRWQDINSQSAGSARKRALDPYLFVLMWPGYGFSIAVLLGQLTSRTVIAATVAVVTVPAVLALWVPSFLISGLPVWQVMIIPGLLLLTSAASQQAWIADRLISPKSFTILGLSILASFAWLVGCLWYRVAEVPDVDEPFDRRAFLAELQPFQNSTGVQLTDVLKRLPSLEISIKGQQSSAPGEERSPGMPGAASSEPSTVYLEGTRFDRTIWADWRRAISARLTSLFASAWYVDLQRAAVAPLGLVDDVRNHHFANLRLYGTRPGDRLGNLMDWRIAQLIESRDFAGALRVMETGLKVARQLENFSSSGSYASGVDLEAALLGSSLDQLLQAARTDRALLQSAQELVRSHSAARPNPTGALKTQILMNDSLDAFESASKSPLDTTYRRLAIQVPWEKERQQRIKRAAAFGALSALSKPGRQPESWEVRQSDPFIEAAQSAGLPPKRGVGTEVSPEEWGAFLLQSWPVNSNYGLMVSFAIAGERAVIVARIAVALRLYQFDHHRAPASLEELVPEYLPALPHDPRGTAIGVEWVETDEIAFPCLVSGLVGSGSPLGQSSWQLAISLENVLTRLSLGNTSPYENQPFVGNMPVAGMATTTSGAGQDQGPGYASPVPIFPRPIVHAGSYMFGHLRENGSTTAF
jgi:hypothetical protein